MHNATSLRTDQERPTPNFLSGVPITAALFAIWLAALLIQAWTRSAWIDELFTANVTDPSVSWREHLPVWKTEPHPPTYSFILWTYRQVVDFGHSILSLRSLSIGLSIVLALGALAYWKSRNWPGLALFAFFMFTAPSMLFFPQETRSYFLMTFGGVYAAMFLLRAFESKTPDKPEWQDVALGVAAAALLGVHLMSMVFAGLLFGMATIAMIIQRRWAWLTTTLLIGVLVIGPAIVVTAVTIFGALASTMQAFWITRWQLVLTVYSLPFATGAPIILTLAYVVWRRREIMDHREKVAAALVLAIMASVLIIGCISVIKPILVVRYLCAPMAALAPLCTVLALSLAPWPRMSAKAGSLSLCGAAIAASLTGQFDADLSPKSDWRTPALALNTAPACRGAEIPYLILNHDPDPANLWAKFFEWYAPEHKFMPALPEAQQQARSQPCAVKLWAAHRVTFNIPGGYREAVARTCSGGPSTALVFVDGFLVVSNEDKATIDAWKGDKMSCETMLNRI